MDRRILGIVGDSVPEHLRDIFVENMDALFEAPKPGGELHGEALEAFRKKWSDFKAEISADHDAVQRQWGTKTHELIGTFVRTVVDGVSKWNPDSAKALTAASMDPDLVLHMYETFLQKVFRYLHETDFLFKGVMTEIRGKSEAGMNAAYRLLSAANIPLPPRSEQHPDVMKLFLDLMDIVETCEMARKANEMAHHNVDRKALRMAMGNIPDTAGGRNALVRMVLDLPGVDAQKVNELARMLNEST